MNGKAVGSRLGGALGRGATDTAVLALALLFGALSRIVPKRRGEIVFYPSFEPRQFSGNLRPVFERMSATPPAGARPVWLTRSGDVERRLHARGLAARRGRGRPLWTLLRAELILLDSTEPRIGFGRFRMVQVWHGSGVKLIGLRKEGRTPMRRAALRAHFRRYALIVAASDRDRIRKAECFANPAVAVLGTPRNDMLFAPADAAAPLRDAGIAPGRRIVAYCPTYREDGRAAPFSEAGWHRLDDWLAASNASFVVKRHVRDGALRIPAGLRHVHDATATFGDVQALLAAADILVTDYSSVSTDFAITGRPIVFYTYDAARFAEVGRGLFGELVDILPGPFAQDEDALIALLADMRWADAPEHRRATATFRQAFHADADDRATARVADAVAGLLGDRRA